MSQITAAPPTRGLPPSILYHPHRFGLRVGCCVGGASCFSIKRVLLAGSTRNTRGPRTGRRMSDEDAPSLTASAPEFVDELPPYTTDAAVQPVQQQVNRNELPLPFLLEEWCARGMLGDDTAPLVAMLSARPKRENEDEQEAAGWAAVGIQCEQSGRALQMQPEPLEAAEPRGKPRCGRTAWRWAGGRLASTSNEGLSRRHQPCARCPWPSHGTAPSAPVVMSQCCRGACGQQILSHSPTRCARDP